MAGEPPARITVRVQPNAKRTEVVRFEDNVLYLRIAVPPVKGKANHEVIRLLADVLGVPKTDITIERGTTSRRKLVCIEGLTLDEVRKRIEGVFRHE
jgi:uncharacterized protein (TIGR00251 family)